MFLRIQGLFGYGTAHSKPAAAGPAEKKQPQKTYSLRTMVASTLGAFAFGVIAERYQFAKHLAPIGTAIKNGVRSACRFAVKNTGKVYAAGVSAAYAHPYIATAIGVATLGGIFFGIRHYRKNAIQNESVPAKKPEPAEVKDIEAKQTEGKNADHADQKQSEILDEKEKETRDRSKSFAEEAQKARASMDSNPKAKSESKSSANSNENEAESKSIDSSSSLGTSVQDKVIFFENKTKGDIKETKSVASPNSADDVSSVEISKGKNEVIQPSQNSERANEVNNKKAEDVQVDEEVQSEASEDDEEASEVEGGDVEREDGINSEERVEGGDVEREDGVNSEVEESEDEEEEKEKGAGEKIRNNASLNDID